MIVITVSVSIFANGGGELCIPVFLVFFVAFALISVRRKIRLKFLNYDSI